MCTNAKSDLRPLCKHLLLDPPHKHTHTHTPTHHQMCAPIRTFVNPTFIHIPESNSLSSIILIKSLIFVPKLCRSWEAQQPVTFEDSYIFINC